jgi:YVTN family beta-propeller protein
MRFLRSIFAPSMVFRAATTGVAMLLAMGLGGCGETFRPIFQPLEGLQPSPAAAHTVVAVSVDGVASNSRGNGSASNIDTSGGSIQGNLIVGLVPAYGALLPNGSKLYVANSADDSVTVNTTSTPTAVDATVSLPPSPSAQITAVTGNGSTATYTYSGTLGVSSGDTIFVTGCATPGFNGVFTVASAAAGSFQVPNSTSATDNPEAPGAQAKTPNAVFAHTADNNNMYVAGYATNSVYVINSSNGLSASVPVGTHPVALAELPNLQYVYVANQGSATVSGTVSVISPTNNTVTATIAPASVAHPVWAVAKSDSSRVYVLDQNGTIYDISPVTNTLICTTTPSTTEKSCPTPIGAGSNFLLFDPVLDRLYVTNPVIGEVAILDASADPPNLLNTINLSSVCSGCAPDSVTALGDGSRAYVGAYQFSPGCVDPSGAAVNCVNTFVGVIDGPSATLKSLVAQPALTVTGVSTNGSEATYSYALNSALPPQAGNNVVITGMSNSANNGTFLVDGAISGTFTVRNPSAASASGENGTGTVLATALSTTGCGPNAGPPPTFWQPGNARFRTSVASSGGGTNSNFTVWVGECDAGSIAIINTFPVNGNPEDAYSGVSLSPPLSTFPPLATGYYPPQNPVLVISGP